MYCLLIAVRLGNYSRCTRFYLKVPSFFTNNEKSKLSHFTTRHGRIDYAGYGAKWNYTRYFTIVSRAMNAKVKFYGTASCGFCYRAERLLLDRGVTDMEKIRVDAEPKRRLEMMDLSGCRTVPQIFINDRHIGGYRELLELDQRGELKKLLSGET